MIVAEIKSRTKVHKEVCDCPGTESKSCPGEWTWDLFGVRFSLPYSDI